VKGGGTNNSTKKKEEASVRGNRNMPRRRGGEPSREKGRRRPSCREGNSRKEGSSIQPLEIGEKGKVYWKKKTITESFGLKKSVRKKWKRGKPRAPKKRPSDSKRNTHKSRGGLPKVPFSAGKGGRKKHAKYPPKRESPAKSAKEEHTTGSFAKKEWRLKGDVLMEGERSVGMAEIRASRGEGQRKGSFPRRKGTRGVVPPKKGL